MSRLTDMGARNGGAMSGRGRLARGIDPPKRKAAQWTETAFQRRVAKVRRTQSPHAPELHRRIIVD